VALVSGGFTFSAALVLHVMKMILCTFEDKLNCIGSIVMLAFSNVLRVLSEVFVAHFIPFILTFSLPSMALCTLKAIFIP
jgi:hypothetical protein